MRSVMLPMLGTRCNHIAVRRHPGGVRLCYARRRAVETAKREHGWGQKKRGVTRHFRGSFLSNPDIFFAQPSYPFDPRKHCLSYLVVPRNSLVPCRLGVDNCLQKVYTICSKSRFAHTELVPFQTTEPPFKIQNHSIVQTCALVPFCA